MIDTSPWPSCSRQSPWLPCSGHTISSTGPSVSPFRDFFTASASTGLSDLFLKGLFSSQVGLGACEIVRSLPYYTSSCKTGPGKWTYFDDVVAQIVPVTDWLNRAMTNSMIDKQTLVPVSKIKNRSGKNCLPPEFPGDLWISCVLVWAVSSLQRKCE